MNHPNKGNIDLNQSAIGQVLTEIRRIETRVCELENGRDSAYEKALIRTYEHLLAMLRQQLSGLPAV